MRDMSDDSAAALQTRPRIAAIAFSALLALAFAALAAGAYWLGVRTSDGQSFDDIVYQSLHEALPRWALLAIAPFASSPLVMTLSALMAAIAVLVAWRRKRWWLLGQMAVFAALLYAASWLKSLLPRPFLINTDSSARNSAPSGHTMLAMGAAVLLLFAVSRAWRVVVALVGACYSMVIGLSVMVGHWHRLSDVVMAMLIVAALAALTLAFTRASGMDALGARASSPSLQIVSTALITAGCMGLLYAAYVVWQIQPGLALSAQWALLPSDVAAVLAVCATAGLLFGVMLALRQVSAAPLSRLGLLGEPPLPPAPSASAALPASLAQSAAAISSV